MQSYHIIETSARKAHEEILKTLLPLGPLYPDAETTRQLSAGIEALTKLIARRAAILAGDRQGIKPSGQQWVQLTAEDVRNAWYTVRQEAME